MKRSWILDEEGFTCSVCGKDMFNCQCSKNATLNKEVEIPFNYSFHKTLGISKHCTSRTKKYGNPGDIFRVDGRTFLLTVVMKMSLWEVATFLYLQEGFKSPKDFKRVWSGMHYKKGYQPAQMVYVHFFTEISES